MGIPLENTTGFNNASLLFGIGAQKAGTSWLYKYLSEHPQVLESPIKEIHYFDTKYMPEYFKGFNRRVLDRFKKSKKPYWFFRLAMINDESAYIGYFKMLYSNQKILPDITPAYSILNADIYKKMGRMHPKTKFLFILRNPVDRIWSQVRALLRHDPTLSIDKVTRRALKADADFWLRTDYRRTIQELYQVIPKKIFLYVFLKHFLGIKQ